MVQIAFYEKTGCGGNARQRAALEAAGHTLQRHDLRAVAWTRAVLLEFLAPLPVAQWFNPAAPRVKSGALQPHALSAGAALDLLLEDPLLIRRPLMRRLDDGSCHVGFDPAAVGAWVGLAPAAAALPLEACPSATHRCQAAAAPGARHADP